MRSNPLVYKVEIVFTAEEYMNSALLNQIGLGSLDIAYFLIGFLVLILILFILNIVALVKLSKWKKKYESFMLGKNAKSMEKEIKNLFTDIEFLKNSVSSNKKEIRLIYRRLKTTYQKLGIVKYDAFNQMGGQLSFALALLDENNDGLILTGIFGRNESTTYAKPVDKGISRYDLSEEELDVLNEAINKVN